MSEKGQTRGREERVWTVGDLMQRDVVTITGDASLRELIQLLSLHGISGCPVVGADRRPVGTVSTTDLLWLSDRLIPVLSSSSRAQQELPGILDEQQVRTIMTPDVFGVEASESLEALSRFFARTGLRRALVLEEGELAGIVSISDLLALIVEEVTDEEGGGPKG